MFTTIKLKAKDRSCKAFFGFYFGLSFLEDVQQPRFYFAAPQGPGMPGSYLSAITSLPPASFASFPNANKKGAAGARLRGNLQIVHRKNIVF